MKTDTYSIFMNLLYYFFVRYFFVGMVRKRLPYNRWGDRLWALQQFVKFHRRLPTTEKTMNDVLYHYKISTEIDCPLKQITTDKEFVKLYIKAMLGDEYNIKTLAVIRSADELNHFTPPPRCAIKTTTGAGAGQVIIKQEGDEVDFNLLRSWFKTDYYTSTRERNYRGLQQKIIVEELAFDNPDADDTKFFCIDGKVKMIQLNLSRWHNHARKYYDRNWNELDVRFVDHPSSTQDIPSPKNLGAMIEAAEKLAEHFSNVRIDMYNNEKKFYIGEITHVHGNANERFQDRESEQKVAKVLFG